MRAACCNWSGRAGTIALASSRVLVRESHAGDLHIEYHGRSLGFQQIPLRPARQNTSTKPPLETKLQADAHPTGELLNHQPERGHF
jgi:hypothetical protein